MKGFVAVLVLCVFPMLYAGAISVISEFRQGRHLSQDSEWQLVDIAVNNALRGKTVKLFGDGALHGRTIKRVWATGDKMTVEATDGSYAVYRFKPVVEVKLVPESITLEANDGTRFEYRPEVESKVQLLPRGRLIRP